MLAWVLMPDHAHWLLQLGKCDSLSAVACRLKSASGRCVNLAMGTQGPVWSRAFHDHAIRNDEGVVGAARYLVANTVSGSPTEEAALSFVRRVAGFAAYPYFRSHFAEVCSQSGIVLPPLPIMKEPKRQIPKAEES